MSLGSELSHVLTFRDGRIQGLVIRQDDILDRAKAFEFAGASG